MSCLNIESIDIDYFDYSGFTMNGVGDGRVDIKQLPYLSVVQSKVGSYGVSLDGGAERFTGDGGFFIAPSVKLQKITHLLNKETDTFCARYIFLGVTVNRKYRLDDLYDFPAVADRETALLFDRDFDEFEKAADICEKMRAVYSVIGHLLKIADEKKEVQNADVYRLLRYIWDNYMNDISVGSLADIMKMSESGLYACFKRTLGTTPAKYINDYRLSVACGLLLRTDDSVKCIAEKVGIPDQFYFSRLFSARYGASPARYRKARLV